VSEKAFDRFTLVLVRRPVDPADLPEEVLDALQEAHLAFLDEMRARGALAAAGPFVEQRDEQLRGLCIYRVGLEETRRLVLEDPLVRARRLEPEVLTWLVPTGEVALHS
jgi:uncharacterized protein YciI